MKEPKLNSESTLVWRDHVGYYKLGSNKSAIILTSPRTEVKLKPRVKLF